MEAGPVKGQPVALCARKPLRFRETFSVQHLANAPLVYTKLCCDVMLEPALYSQCPYFNGVMQGKPPARLRWINHDGRFPFRSRWAVLTCDKWHGKRAM